MAQFAFLDDQGGGAHDLVHQPIVQFTHDGPRKQIESDVFDQVRKFSIRIGRFGIVHLLVRFDSVFR